jgi:hypothetical protein
MVVVEMIVVVIVPIMLGAPPAPVNVPPTMTVVPTVRASFGQFVAGVVRFAAFGTVVFDSFVKVMVGPDDALLAIIRRRLWSRDEDCCSKEKCGYDGA